MSLHEVRIGKEPIEAVTFSQIGKKKKESEELAAQVDEFIAKGGIVTTYIPCKTGIGFIPVNEFTGEADQSRIKTTSAHNAKQKEIAGDGVSFYGGQNRAKNRRSKLGQNIKRQGNGIVVELSGFKSHQFPDTEEGHQQARECRDRKRKAYGLPPAEY